MNPVIQCLSPVDGSLFAEREITNNKELKLKLANARVAQAQWRTLSIDERATYCRAAVSASVAQGGTLHDFGHARAAGFRRKKMNDRTDDQAAEDRQQQERPARDFVESAGQFTASDRKIADEGQQEFKSHRSQSAQQADQDREEQQKGRGIDSQPAGQPGQGPLEPRNAFGRRFKHGVC